MEGNRRVSLRLQGYDYNQTGAYFVTICVQERACLFGKIAEGTMHLSEAGCMTERWFYEMEKKFPDLMAEQFVCMPNHIHFIVVNQRVPLKGEKPLSLSTVVQWYKTMTTNEYIRQVKYGGWEPFRRKLWQRNYWERIIRDEAEYVKIGEYIENNPARWKEDTLFVCE
ncbi:transposase [Chrysiogenes arsenatis]|uniref:transposase n=1 Tax=Chrysiogenes arsenatis TaxID=309797 RepID=UPI00047F149F|nr:transposase [Chrysiogenes arsenatis]